MSLLTETQIHEFRRNGFITLSQIAPPEEVARIKKIIYALFEKKAGWEQGAQFDMVGLDDGKAPATSPQIINPVSFAPELEHTQFRTNAFTIARELLGPDAQCSYEHSIFKPPQVGSPTPWHQDEAFRSDTEVEYDSISLWMPLQEVKAENGCLEFIPGSHLGEVLSHRSPNNDPRIHALECDGEFDRSAAVACPLPAGGVTIHHSRTLHHAGANTSKTERCAYVLTFKTPERPAAKRDFYWNANKQTARLARRRAWRWRGGLLPAIRRKIGSLLSRK